MTQNSVVLPLFHSGMARYKRISVRSTGRAIGRAATIIGLRRSAQIFQISPSLAYYYKQKYMRPNFRTNSWGGRRKSLLTKEQEKKMADLIFQFAEKNPLTNITEFRRLCLVSGYVVSRSYLARVFTKWKWSWKKPSYIQINKYSIPNIRYYAVYLSEIIKIPWKNIKYADESSFKSKDLLRRRAVSPIGVPVRITNMSPIELTYTMTLLCHLDNPELPLAFDLRHGSNTQWDFFDFVLNCIEQKYLVEGDYFIIDNASVHHGCAMWPILTRILTLGGIKLIYLPTYSPELNPCELVFSYIKRYIREHRGTDRFVIEILTAISLVNYNVVKSFYKKCIIDV